MTWNKGDDMTQTEEKNMAHAYTPGLKIKKVETVRKERVLPIEGEVLVKVGDKVDFHTTLAHTEIPGDAEILNVCETLGVDPGAVFDYMLKKEGEQFEEGEILAKYTAFWGLVKNYVYAPFSGIIESVSGLTGQVIIRQNNIALEVDSYIRGKVVEIIPSKGAVVETQAAFIQGIFGFGGENHGEITIAVSSPSELLKEDNIKAEHKGKIIIGGSGVTSAAYKKALEIGVKGIVVGGMNVEDLIGILGEDIGVAITGEEDVKITVIATEGFGALPMSDRTFNLFKDVEGKMSAINGATQIRAGVLRPEIIVPYDEGESITLSGERFSDGMAQGSLVRIIRAPYFGEIAKVAGLPVNLQTVQSGSKVRVIEVELEDGRIVTVPRANVEIIEE
jgi:hypothetical protein